MADLPLLSNPIGSGAGLAGAIGGGFTGFGDFGGGSGTTVWDLLGGVFNTAAGAVLAHNDLAIVNGQVVPAAQGSGANPPVAGQAPPGGINIGGGINVPGMLNVGGGISVGGAGTASTNGGGAVALPANGMLYRQGMQNQRVMARPIIRSINPQTGQCDEWVRAPRPGSGRPLVWAGDIRAAKRAKKGARKAASALGLNRGRR